MGEQVFSVDAKCKACGGTGLYVGVAERVRKARSDRAIQPGLPRGCADG